MLKFRTKYWNCSKFANIIRGCEKPKALTLEGWQEWKKDQEKNNYIRYIMAEKMLNKIQNIVYFPYDLLMSIKKYVEYRYIKKTHFLKTGFDPGFYYEFDERVLFGLFNELKEFVEVDLAKSYAIYNKKKKKKRSAEYGLEYLNWASKLKQKGRLTEQAKNSIKITKLYKWWIERPNRVLPNDLLIENKYSISAKKAAFKKYQKTEEDYEKEDEKMLIELIKIRKNLWI